MPPPINIDLGMGTKRGTPWGTPSPASAKTPPFFPSSGGDLTTVPPSDALTRDPSTPNPDAEELRNLIAHPPPTTHGIKRVLGTLASVGGLFVPGLAQAGQELTQPGVTNWGGDIVRRKELMDISDKELGRQIQLENLRSLAEQRKASEQDRQERQYKSNTQGLLPIHVPNEIPMSPALQSPETFRQGQDSMANVVMPQLRTTVPSAMLPPSPAIQGPAPPPMLARPEIAAPVAPGPQRAGISGNLGDLTEPETGKPMSQAGTIVQVPKPGGGTVPFLKPSPTTVNTLAANKELATRKAALQAEQDKWPTATPEMAADPDLAGLGIVAGQKVNPVIAQPYLTNRFKPTKEAKPNTPEQQYIDEYQKKHEGASVAEAVAAYKKIPGPPPQISPTVTDNRLDRSYQYNSGRLDKLQTPIDEAARRIGRLQDTIAQGNMQSDALVAPELLSVMAGGMGSGLRMNEAEISRIVGGRTNLEGLKAALNKWKLDPNAARSITPAQQQQISALVKTVNDKVVAKQQALDAARSSLVNANDVMEHRKITTAAMSKLAEIDRGGVPPAAPTPAAAAPGAVPTVGGMFNGAKVLKVTKVQ